MRVLVTGGRFNTRRDVIYAALDEYHEEHTVDVIIHGAAAGVDVLCGEWAEHNGIPVQVYPITEEDWYLHGRSAGPKRNQKMLDDGDPDILIAFLGGNGTKDMVARAKRANLEIWEPHKDKINEPTLPERDA